jgi:hypothetical protein
MKTLKNGLQITMLMLAGVIASHARADVLYIPFSTGLSGNSVTPACNNYPANFFMSDGPHCWAQIPISIPAGRTIQQLTLFHSNGAAPSPFIEASLHVVTMSTNTPGEDVKFAWNSGVALFNGEVERRAMMVQLPIKGGMVYPDQFPVVANTMYTLVVQLNNGAAVEGLQVTYY